MSFPCVSLEVFEFEFEFEYSHLSVITPVNLFRAIKRIVLYQYRVMTVFEFEFFCFDDQPIFDIVVDDDDDERIFSNLDKKKRNISSNMINQYKIIDWWWLSEFTRNLPNIIDKKKTLKSEAKKLWPKVTKNKK